VQELLECDGLIMSPPRALALPPNPTATATVGTRHPRHHHNSNSQHSSSNSSSSQQPPYKAVKGNPTSASATLRGAGGGGGVATTGTATESHHYSSSSSHHYHRRVKSMSSASADLMMDCFTRDCTSSPPLEDLKEPQQLPDLGSMSMEGGIGMGVGIGGGIGIGMGAYASSDPLFMNHHMMMPMPPSRFSSEDWHDSFIQVDYSSE
jgi:hypothetical protein